MATPLNLGAIELKELQARPPTFPPVTTHPESLTPSRLLISPQAFTNPSEPLVSDKIYSGFLEHLGRCIYGGILDDPKKPSEEKLLQKQDKGRLGWRKDVIDVIGGKGELEVPIFRWPGGNFVSNYHWQDGIGPAENRPKRIELAWLSDESNLFGTDEFIDWCRAAGSEPFICLNMGSGTYEEALSWLEYCNGKGDTHWANLRRKYTGRDEPHNVKYWGLGNEMWGPWQVGKLKASEYAEKAKIWAHGLKLVDPRIKLVSCGEEGNSQWDRTVLQELIGEVDMHSIHLYTTLGHKKWNTVEGFEYEKNVFGPAAAERNIEICKSLIDSANIHRGAFGVPANNVKIAFDEWNVWDDEKGHTFNGLEQVYDFTDMLGFVGWLNVLVRKHADLGMACLAQSVNVIAPILTTPNGLLKQTIFYPLQLFSKYMKTGHLIHLPTLPDVYTGPTHPLWIQQTNIRPAYVDLVAVLVGTSIRLSVLNRHPTAEWSMDLRFDGYKVKSVEVHEIYSDDLGAKNTFENPTNLVPQVSKLSPEDWSKGKRVVKKHSWSFFIFEGTLGE